jgi:hypothetical protein
MPTPAEDSVGGTKRIQNYSMPAEREAVSPSIQNGPSVRTGGPNARPPGHRL